MTRPANLRESMPRVAAWIDDLRAAFGADAINGQIRRGLAGEPVFHASEGGREVGMRAPAGGREISAADMVIEKPKKEENSAARR